MTENSRRIVIVGGVAAGMSAATRARRLDENAEIIVLERGEYVSFANCGLPYYAGGVIVERDNLVLQTPEALRARFRIDVRTRCEVVRVDGENKRVHFVSPSGSEQLEFDELILAPGARPVTPPIPGIERALTLRSLPDVDAISERLATRPRVCIIGGGFIGVELAENLRRRDLEVTLVEAAEQILAPFDAEMAAPISARLTDAGVSVRCGAQVSEVTDGGVGLDSGEQIPADLVISAIGVRPDTDFLADSGIKLDQRGAIEVDRMGRTNIANIYAAGDATKKLHRVSGESTLVPLAGPANQEGRHIPAVINFPQQTDANPAVLATAVIGVFGLEAATTGLNERAARAAGFEVEVLHTHPFDHVTYYPGAKQLAIKLVFEAKTGRILGAQAVGENGAARRIDVLATAIYAGLRAPQLAEIDLCYAPQFGAAKDAVNMLGFASENILTGLTPNTTQLAADALVLDVRTAAEFARGAIPGALNIELDGLRENLDQLRGALDEYPQGQATRVIVYCAVGVRAHSATRILRQAGFNAVNLSGGWRTYQARQL